MTVLKRSQVREWIRPRPVDSHKGSNGHVLLWAGSRGMAGAAVLAATGALRSGAGLVTVATCESERSVITHQRPEALTLGLPENSDGELSPDAEKILRGYAEAHDVTVLALGPGLSQGPVIQALVKRLVAAWSKPLVIDADGLNNLTPADLPQSESLVITPHPGEFSRFFGLRKEAVAVDREGHAARAARNHHLVCLLKGSETIISDGKLSFVNPTGNPAMATGGMGDVLTGVVASLLGQGLAALSAAAAAAFIHGLAADLIAVSDRGLLALDVAHALPQALRRIGVRA